MLLDLALSPTSTGCTSSYKACCSTWPLHVVWDPLNFSRLSTFSTFWLIRLINLSNHDFPFLDSTVQDSLALYLSLEPGSYRCLLRICSPNHLCFSVNSNGIVYFAPTFSCSDTQHTISVQAGCVPVPALRSSEQCFREGLC